MNTIKKNIYLFIGYLIVNSIIYIVKLIALDIYFNLNDLYTPNQVINTPNQVINTPNQVINTPNQVPFIFKITFTESCVKFLRMLSSENVLIYKSNLINFSNKILKNLIFFYFVKIK